MSNATELLRRYVEEKSESAFTEIVREHLNLVYSAALRETSGDGAMAEDVSQAVFTELARQAPRLQGHPCLAGWLYTTVRHVSANWRRAERDRRHREEEATSMRELLSEDSPNEIWRQIRPVLDDALHDLKESDRAVLVLRFLEDRPLREVGAHLGINENTARMRADRALEKLRGFLARRGITSTTAGVAAALAVGAMTPAPTALAASTAGAALASGAVAGSTTFTLLRIMSLTKMKISLIGAVVLAGLAVPTWQQTRLNRLESENAQLRARAAETPSQATEITTPPVGVEGQRNIEADQTELERLRQWQAKTQPELLRLRGMAGVARRSNAELEQLRGQVARQTTEAAANPMSGAMNKAMEQQMDGRLARMTASLHLTPEQTKGIREILMRQAQVMSAGMQQVFSGKYDKDELAKLGKEGGNPEEQIKALLTPAQLAAYQDYQQEEATHNASVAANTELLQMQSALNLTSDQLDRAYAALYEVTMNQLTGRVTTKAATPGEQMQWALDQKVKALEPVLTPAQFETYRQQQALQSKLMKDIMSKMDIGGGSK